jgi:hypothetical protein
MRGSIRATMCVGAMACGTLVLFGSPVGATTAGMTRWMHKYGGNLKAVDDDAENIARANASFTSTDVLALARSLTSDSTKLEGLPSMPSHKFEKELATALSTFAKGSIMVQGGVRETSDLEIKNGGRLIGRGIAVFRQLVKELKADGISLSKINAKHTNISGPASTTATTTPTTTTTITTKNHVGDTLSTSTISIQLQQVIDPAHATNEFLQPSAGNRYVAIKTQITNPGTANLQSDANSNFSVIGSNGQIYTATFATITGCTNFDDGEYGLTAGSSVVGCVTFQVPTGVTVSKVDFESTTANTRATWTVP